MKFCVYLMNAKAFTIPMSDSEITGLRHTVLVPLVHLIHNIIERVRANEIFVLVHLLPSISSRAGRPRNSLYRRSMYEFNAAAQKIDREI